MRAAAITTAAKGQDIAEAAALAGEATHVVLFLGEPVKWSGESATLAEPRLPFIQRRLTEKVRRANPQAKLIVFVTAGRAIHIPCEVEEAADAIFWTAHLGTFAGDAIADILAGVASPTARLSHGLPFADGITSGFNSRQARIDRPAVPVVPGSESRRQRHHWCAYYLGLGARWPAAYTFGEGYSYTSFALSDWSLDVRALSVSAGTLVTASVQVTNTGSRAGTETVHLYYQDMVCEERVPRLLERLGHQQVTLAPGEAAVLSFAVAPGMLAKYGRDPEAGRRVWPDRNPAENPDRLFLVQHEGQALDAIERFGDAPCVLTFTLVP